MGTRKLWEKMFSAYSEKEALELHISGATVRNRNPFEELEVPRNQEELTVDFIEKWVLPFYMAGFNNLDASVSETFAKAASEITKNEVEILLGDFDWRPRSCGAFFAAINNYSELDEVIGRHLVKSEVCYAGGAYSLALAMFGTENAKKYLKEYLDYYLDRPDLNFDQADAYCALEYIDKISAGALMHKWRQFSSGKTYLNLDRSRKRLAEEIASIIQIREMML